MALTPSGIAMLVKIIKRPQVCGLFLGGRSVGFRYAQRKPAVFRTLRVLVPAQIHKKKTPKRVPFFLVDDQGLEAVGEIAESL